jgi:hypothetical protein
MLTLTPVIAPPAPGVRATTSLPTEYWTTRILPSSEPPNAVPPDLYSITPLGDWFSPKS